MTTARLFGPASEDRWQQLQGSATADLDAVVYPDQHRAAEVLTT